MSVAVDSTHSWTWCVAAVKIATVTDTGNSQHDENEKSEERAVNGIIAHHGEPVIYYGKYKWRTQ